MKNIKGALMVLASAILFSFMTLLIKVIVNLNSISILELLFFRMLLGLIIIIFYFKIKNIKYSFHNKSALFYRALFGTIAMAFFFFSIKYTTITKSNLLNMTYPLIVGLLSSNFLNEKISIRKICIILISIFGIYLILDPKLNDFIFGDILALISGILAGAAITSLRLARKSDSALSTMIFFNGFASIFALALGGWSFSMPSLNCLLLILLMSLIGNAAQFCLSYGFKFIRAVEGSIISLSRIFFAGILGVLFFQDKITLSLLIGSFILILCNIFIIFVETKQMEEI